MKRRRTYLLGNSVMLSKYVENSFLDNLSYFYKKSIKSGIFSIFRNLTRESITHMMHSRNVVNGYL